jgi:hypothetical protein
MLKRKGFYNLFLRHLNFKRGLLAIYLFLQVLTVLKEARNLLISWTLMKKRPKSSLKNCHSGGREMPLVAKRSLKYVMLTKQWTKFWKKERAGLLQA